MDVKVIEIVKEFEGIIGVVFGSVATLVTSHLLKNIGQLHIYFDYWDAYYQGRDSSGGVKRVDPGDQPFTFEFFFEVDIYNSSDNFKILRNVCASFERKGKEQLETLLYQSKSLKIDEIKVVNVSPKTILHFDLYGYIGEDQLDKILNADKVYLKFLNEKNRTIRKLISNKPA
jgi:hypothetical protein